MRRLQIAWVVLAAGCGAGPISEPTSTPDTTEATTTGPTPVTDPTPTDGFPCDVRAVLETYCAVCHTGETYSPSYYTVAEVRALSKIMVQLLEDPKNPMPPANAPSHPSADERAVLEGWVADGTPGGACGPLTPPPAPVTP
jgi:hypothetical protein